MATFTKVLLSGSTSGRGILVAATATPGTAIHATGTSSTVIDEMWLLAHNTSSSTVTLTLEYGGVTSPNDTVIFGIPSKSGLTLLVPGLPLVGTGAATTTVKAFAATANVLTIQGYVNRIT